MAADDRLTRSEDPEDELARRLREAHRRVRALPVPAETKQRLAKRLLAICELSKRDLGPAATRLESFLIELDVLILDTQSAGNIAEGD
ncbi:hypothetical protein [Planobispora longispora]|uniref:Uncharacterized protein n=1 Tax=Planobispora longispora TaxID=28887 RepID=A0A8J3RLD1_9ACTN|nr:hypothetical protein [Planobispora longispora]BFE82976.1 hypothetical protein GCM10020093_055770 [Planobispora longispora]GIH78671.1 hypothetical protein Plo01_51000 [Planobispora longispora]